MKCIYYTVGTLGLCERAPWCPDTDNCSLGWIAFWTPAERAGLKAMGTVLRGIKKSLFHSWLIQTRGFPGWRLWRVRNRRQGAKITAYHMIRAYVQAARKIKEEK